MNAAAARIRQTLLVLSSIGTLLLAASTSAQFVAPIGPPAAINTNAGSDTGFDHEVGMATDGIGNWVAVWYSNDSLGSTIGVDFDVLVARSSDDGASWSPPAALNTNAGTDSRADTDPEVLTDGGGNWLVVWASQEDLGGVIGTDDDILSSISTDNGASWTTPAVVNSSASTDSGEDILPQIATDGAGNIVVVWQSQDDLAGTIGTDRDILFSRSPNNGVSWSITAALNTNASSDTSINVDRNPKIATDDLGNWLVAWNSDTDLGGIGTDRDIFLSRSTDDGVTWSPPATLNTNAATDAGSDNNPDLANDGAGNWVAAWRSTDSLGATIGTDNDIFLATSSNHGVTWTAPAALNSNAGTDSGSDEDAEVATDGAGNWVVAWKSTESLGATIGTDYDILIAHSADDGATWTAPALANTNGGSDTRMDLTPALVRGAGGNWVLAWNSEDDVGGTIGTDRDVLGALFQIAVGVPTLGGWGHWALIATLLLVASALARWRGASRPTS